jgi:hypothetical protein
VDSLLATTVKVWSYGTSTREPARKHTVSMLRRPLSKRLRLLIKRLAARRSFWRRLFWIVGLLIVVVIAIWGLFGTGAGVVETKTTHYSHYGGETRKEVDVSRTLVGPKSTWEWYSLLLPVSVPLIITWYSARERVQTDLRAHDEALQTYLSEITKLMGADRDADRDLGDREQNNVTPTLVRGDPAQNGVAPTLVRARTLTLLGRLNLPRLERRGLVSDAIRKRHIVRFLYEVDLVKDNPSVVGLEAADLSYADLKELELIKANLSEANLSNADLRGAVLSGANLQGADFEVAKVTIEQIKEHIAAAKTLNGATMPDGQKYEKWIKSKEGRQLVAAATVHAGSL